MSLKQDDSRTGSAVYRFGSFAADLRVSLPQAASDQARRTIKDNIGVMLAGASTRRGVAISEAIGSLNAPYSPGNALIIGTGRACGARMAAMHGASMLLVANTMSGYRSSIAPGFHPAEVVVPGVLSSAFDRGASGREVIQATVAGLEVGARLCEAMMPSHAYRGFHQCATIGALSGAVAIATLHGGSAAEISEALAIAPILAPMAIVNLQSSGLPGGDRLPSAKALDSAAAARAAFDAAVLAAGGLTGQASILDGSIGFCAATSDFLPGDADLTKALGSEFLSERAYYKLYGVTRWFHEAVDLTLRLTSDLRIEPADVERVIVTTIEWTSHRNRRTTPSSDIWDCLTGSLSYAVASAVLYPAEMTEPGLYSDEDRPRRLLKVHEFEDRIEVIADSTFTRAFPGRIPTAVEVITKDGAIHGLTSEYMRGDEPERPLTAWELEDKFRRHASMSLPDASVSQLSELLDNLGELETLRDVARLLTSSARH